MPPIVTLIKPASSNCSLRCKYCFYFDETKNRTTPSFGFMSTQTIEAIISKACSYAEGHCTFAFQGGEPTLAGLDFFRHVIDLQKKYTKSGLTISNAIQTNAMMIDDEWASFLAENNFLVGVSLDGYESLHNLYRRDSAGKGTFDRVMRGIEFLKKHNAQFNILTVVTAQTAKNIKDVYAFFMRKGFVYQQYIPCLEPMDDTPGKQKYSLTPELYALFLKNLFDVWYQDRIKGKFVYNRYFENLAGILLGRVPESCDARGFCSMQYAFEADGSVYPCDFYMLDDYCIGNINHDSLEAIDSNRYDSGFIQQSKKLPEQCRNCRWLSVCRGGCRRTRILEGDPSGRNISYFCRAYQEAFPYILPRLNELVGNFK